MFLKKKFGIVNSKIKCKCGLNLDFISDCFNKPRW